MPWFHPGYFQQGSSAVARTTHRGKTCAATFPGCLNEHIIKTFLCWEIVNPWGVGEVQRNSRAFCRCVWLFLTLSTPLFLSWCFRSHLPRSPWEQRNTNIFCQSEKAKYQNSSRKWNALVWNQAIAGKPVPLGDKYLLQETDSLCFIAYTLCQYLLLAETIDILGSVCFSDPNICLTTVSVFLIPEACGPRFPPTFSPKGSPLGHWFNLTAELICRENFRKHISELNCRGLHSFIGPEYCSAGKMPSKANRKWKYKRKKP